MSKIIWIFSCIFLFVILNTANAAAGCCSYHGGVSGCNSSTGHSLCKDGTDSPSCACSGAKILNKSSGKATNYKKNVIKTSTTTTIPSRVKASKTSVTTVKTKTTGCCSRHGGVAACNKQTGFQMCKDGTTSSTCKCQ